MSVDVQYFRSSLIRSREVAEIPINESPPDFGFGDVDQILYHSLISLAHLHY